MLVYDESQSLMRDAVAGLLGRRSSDSSARHSRDAATHSGHDHGLWKEMAQHGWTGVMVDEEFDGADFGLVGATIICRELGIGLLATPFVSTSVMAALALREADAELRKRWLPGIANGEVVLAVALEEGTKHTPCSSWTSSAARQGDEWLLNGSKTFVADACDAHAILLGANVEVRPGQAEPALFLVEASRPGLIVERVVSLDGRNTARVRAENIRLPLGHRLAGDTGGVARVLDAGRLGIAAEAAGIAEATFARTLDYVKNRVQFDRRIGSFQAVQHRLARLHCEIEMLNSVVLAGAQAAESGSGAATVLISAAKVKAEIVGGLTVSESIQFHGGIGMTDELDLGAYMKRMRTASESLGDAYLHLDRFAALEGY